MIDGQFVFFYLLAFILKLFVWFALQWFFTVSSINGYQRPLRAIREPSTAKYKTRLTVYVKISDFSKLCEIL